MSAINCEVCGGSGAVQVSVPVCCERPHRSGECCGNAVEGYDWEPCSNCGGAGFYPNSETPPQVKP